jgi:hypothetical protein
MFTVLMEVTRRCMVSGKPRQTGEQVRMNPIDGSQLRDSGRGRPVTPEDEQAINDADQAFKLRACRAAGHVAGATHPASRF